MQSQRKNQINTLAVIALILLQCSLAKVLSTQEKSNSFLQSETKESYGHEWMKGFWIGKGYGCGGRSNIPEDIEVTYFNGEFVATKVNGDDCVPSGNVTFRGKLPDNFESNKEYPCVITLGNPQRPASGTGQCRVVPVEKDKFKVLNWNLEFIRGRLNPPEEPKPVEKPVPEEPKPVVVIPTPILPRPELPVQVVIKEEKPEKEKKPCNKYNPADHLPRGEDDEDIYTKHIDVVEKYRKAKNPYRRYRRDPNNTDDDDEDLVLVPRRWLKVPEQLKERENGHSHGRGRGNRRDPPRRRERDDDNDDDSDDENDYDDNEDDRVCRRKNRRHGSLRLEN